MQNGIYVPALSHGGDWAGYKAEYGELPLDFSSNISPLGLPENVKAAVIAALEGICLYPDPLCRALRDAISQREQLSPSWCLCGSGAADLIYRAVLEKKPKHAVLTAPTFLEYEAALTLADCTVTHYTLKEENGFLLQRDFLDAITAETDAVFLCEPNNPTGRTTPQERLLEVLERCKTCGALLVVDECFGDFLEDTSSCALKNYLGKYGNLIILKAFTKLYAMAGLRLGYCLCSDAMLLDAMRAAGQPWPVSNVAQAAGVAALHETAYVQTVRALIAAERPWLRQELEKSGFRVVPGEANYLLFFSPVPLSEPLRKRGILLRDCANYRGLCPGWYRTAVRTHAENQRLIAALRKILQEGTP